jgi:hypothetical protein
MIMWVFSEARVYAVRYFITYVISGAARRSGSLGGASRR